MVAVCDLKEKVILDDPTIMDNVFNITSRNDENTNSNLNKKDELDTKKVANQREKPLERKEMFLNQLKRKLIDPKGSSSFSNGTVDMWW